MQYRVKLLTAAFTVEETVLDASSEAEARQLAANAGGRVLELRPAKRNWLQPAAREEFNLAVFNQQLHSLIDAGQTVVDAIDVLSQNDRRGRGRSVYEVLLRELRQGNPLSNAMASLPSVFPALYVAMVRSSETTGTLRAAISRYMQYQGQVDEIRGKLRAAATYPAVLLGVGFLVIAFLMFYVLPRFSAVYEDAGTMRNGDPGFVQWWGTFVRNNELAAWGSLGVVVALLLLLIFHPAVRSGAYRWLMQTSWLGERLQVLQLARLYRTLGMLLHSGVSVLAAMRMTKASLPLALHPSLDKAVQRVGEGIAMSAALQDCGLSTEVAVRLLVAGESSGNLDEMMGRIADFYDQETTIWIDTVGRLIEPVLMLGIGLVVGAIVLMLYSPIFDLANIV
ncbi:type II secretion system F family protein [Massilia endophytica]|uniref:type II secretion system F family protein n=1 Tax=Massilia endophytica TaxID=2899220 RepID=UPI001E3074B3|nr:type II secretion system F family protein [Massilia endophytica]UGQ48744.1 type II secretion system F family protein [Massilia endophytica]